MSVKIALFLSLAMVAGLFASDDAEARTSRRRPATVRHAPLRFEATAFSTFGVTQKGTVTHDGVVAADPSVLPLGSIIRIENAGLFSGRYVVTDTGSKIVGRHIDVYIPSRAQAKEFGKRVVTVRLLVRGDNVKNDHLEVTPAAKGAPVPPVPVPVARK